VQDDLVIVAKIAARILRAGWARKGEDADDHRAEDVSARRQVRIAIVSTLLMPL
jgi:hypothetical protein